MRILSHILLAILVISLTSCGGDKKSTPNKENAVTEKKAATFVMNDGSEVEVTTRPLTQADRDRVAKNSMKNTNKGEQPTPGTFSRNSQGAQDPATLPKSNKEKLNSVPDACALISPAQVAKIFGVTAADIDQKDASHTKSPYTRSCFYRWDGASPNTGILLQVQANPVAEEYAEWVSLFVESKRTTGEKEMGSDETYKYDKLEGLGDDGSYSHRLGKYIWRDGNNYAFMVAFNTNSAPEVQMKNVQTIGKIMMENYAKLK